MAIAKRKRLHNKLDYQVTALKLRREGFTWSQIAEQLGITEEELRELADVERPAVRADFIARLKDFFGNKSTISVAQEGILQQALTGEVRRQGSPDLLKARAIHELAKLYPDRMREVVERLKKGGG